MAKILVVDDDPVTLTLIKDILTKEGHEILTAQTGQQGIILARQHRPEMILMDIVMPDLDGAETVARIIATPELTGIPFVIFVSGIVSADPDVPATITVGDRTYPAVAKPLKTGALLAAVQAGLPSVD